MEKWVIRNIKFGNMSTYEEISERIGWFGAADIPTVEAARELLAKVMDEHCKASFEKVLRIHRFAPVPYTEEELIALEIIIQAYKIGSLIFRNI
jgi:hypothetical protein